MCAAGTYAGAGATACAACAGGTYDDDAETHSEGLPASTACVVCGAGNSATATSCLPCAAGTADLNHDSSDACDECVAETSFTDTAGQEECSTCQTCDVTWQEIYIIIGERSWPDYALERLSHCS